MEAWKDGDRVRPIPIDDDELVAGAPPPPSPPSRGPKRPWLPLAVAGAAVIVAVVSVAAFGALRFDDPDANAEGDLFSATTTEADGSTTTTTTLPPRLEELLPGITDRLTLVTEYEGRARTLLWDPSFRVPKEYELDIASTPRTQITSATFDSGGRTLAVERCDGQGSCDVWVGSPTDLGTDPDLEGTLSHVWHASAVGQIAWVAPSADGYTLSTATANPLTNSVGNVEKRFTSDVPFRIIQWDSIGFVINSFVDGSQVAAITPDGDTMWMIDGSATTATETIVAIHDPPAGWTVVDRIEATPLDETATPDEVLYVGTSDTAQLVARLAQRSGGRMYSLTVMGSNLNAPRIITIENPYDPLGFTADGTYFVFVDQEDLRTVFFVDWNRGPTRSVRAPEGHRVIGIDVG